jgi:hypothetical protein
MRTDGGKCGTLSNFFAVYPALRRTGSVAGGKPHLISRPGFIFGGANAVLETQLSRGSGNLRTFYGGSG